MLLKEQHITNKMHKIRKSMAVNIGYPSPPISSKNRTTRLWTKVQSRWQGTKIARWHRDPTESFHWKIKPEGWPGSQHGLNQPLELGHRFLPASCVHTWSRSGGTASLLVSSPDLGEASVVGRTPRPGGRKEPSSLQPEEKFRTRLGSQAGPSPKPSSATH